MVKVGTGGVTLPPVENLIRTSQSAERRGYDGLWWPDHLMGWLPQTIWTPDIGEVARYQPNPHVFFDPVAAIAAAAVHTEAIDLGTAVTEPIRRHPAELARSFLTLHHLSQGRVILGLGAGELENIEPYGFDYSTPVSKLEEALTIIRLLWSGNDPVDFDGDFWQLEEVTLGEVPPDDPLGRPAIWIGAHGPRMLRLTGRFADGWLPTYGQEPAEWAAGLEAVREAGRESGRDPGSIVPAMWAPIVIGSDVEEVEQLLQTPMMRAWTLTAPSQIFEALGYEHPLAEDFYALTDYVPARLSREEALAAIDRVPAEVVSRFILSGTPDTIVGELMEFVDAGMDYVVLQNLTFLADFASLRKSFELQDDLLASLRSAAPS